MNNQLTECPKILTAVRLWAVLSGPGKSSGFLFKEDIMGKNLDKKGDAILRLERVEAIWKFLNWVGKDKIYTSIPFESFVQNCGELIEDDLRHIKEYYVG